MRHWKKYVLLATGFALMLPVTAMASQENTGNQKMVTVEVKNVKGGALPVGYRLDNGPWKSLPIGEKVEIPEGTELYLEGYNNSVEWYNQYGIDYIEGMLKDVHVTTKDGVKEEISSNTYMVEEDCTIEPEFKWEVWHDGYLESGYYAERAEIHYDAPSIVEAKIKAFKDGKEIKFSDLKDVSLGKLNESKNPEYIDQFELTNTGIRSKKKIPLGEYDVPFCYQNEEGSYREEYCCIQVGSEATVGNQPMAVYKGDDGEERVLWDNCESEFGIPNPNYDKNAYENTGVSGIFDAEKTTLGEILKLAHKLEDEYGFAVSSIAGYTLTGEYADLNGNIVEEDSSRTMKGLYEYDRLGINLRYVYKKGTKIFKPVTVQPLPKNQIVYRDSFVEDNGERYYYDIEGNLVKNEWVDDGYDEVFCGENGAIVTNGIAGISMEEGLYFVDENGWVKVDKNGIMKNGFLTYVIENGKVTEIKVEEVATPSNASNVKDLADGLDITLGQLNQEQKVDYADKLSAGITGLNAAEKSQLDDAMLEKADTLLREIYGTEVNTEVSAEDDVDDAVLLAASDIKVKGALAAAGITSENAESDVQVKLTQIAATASNAAAASTSKGILKFRAELYVDDVKLQLNAPIIFEITLPGEVKDQYSPLSYTFKVEHVKDNQTKETLIPKFSDDYTAMSIRTNSFSTFELIATKKTSSSSSSGHNNSHGKNGSGRHAAKQRLIGKWMKDTNGWQYRFYNATWARKQWIELEWNGITGWYYFDANGYMVTGWHKDGDQWYYLNPKSDGSMGVMVTGWKQIDNIWYYFNTAAGNPKGAMLKNATTSDGYRVGADGAWVE